MTLTALVRSRPLRAAALATLLAGTAIGGLAATDRVRAEESPAAAQGAIQPTGPSARLPDFSHLVAQVLPAVVSVEVRLAPQPAADMRGEDGPGEGPGDGQGGDGGPMLPFRMPGPPHPPRGVEGRGSGFIVAADGTIVTNNHVVRGARSITVTLNDGTQLPAKVIGQDAGTDLAVLRVSAGHALPFLSLGDSDHVSPGEWVIAVGNPFGLSGTVTAGIVSARGRDIGDGPYNSSFIQIDAPINRGNSGGPLLTQDGQVIGVNSAILSPTGGSIGIGFAIPASTVRTVVAQLEESGHVTRGFIGVEVQAVTPAMAAAVHLPKPAGESGGGDAAGRGALIANVSPDGPAAQAGLQAGDVVQAVDGHAVHDPRELAQAVAAIKPGARATLAVVRDGHARTMDVTIGTLPAPTERADRGGDTGRPAYGIGLAALTPDLRQQLELPDATRGVVISQVQQGSPAEAAGLRQGDVLLGVGGTPVRDPRQAIEALRHAAGDGTPVALRILRDGHAAYVAVSPNQGGDRSAG